MRFQFNGATRQRPHGLQGVNKVPIFTRIPQKWKEVILLFAIGLPIVIGGNYLAALSGHPTSYWMFHNILGIID